MRLTNPFSFAGRLKRRTYLAWCIGVFAVQYIVAALAIWIGQETPYAYWSVLITPLRPIAFLQASIWAPLAAMAATLVVTWLLLALSLRRASDAGLGPWIAALASLPLAQIAAIAVLAQRPTAAEAPPSATAARGRDDGLATGALDDKAFAEGAVGALAGAAIMVGAVAVSTLILGVYGYSLFVVSPFVSGAAAGYAANRGRILSVRSTLMIAIVALAFSAGALVGLALEGVVCVALAGGLAVVPMFLGALAGREAAKARGSARGSLTAVALLPVLFGFEHVAPSTVTFDQSQSVTIVAPPAAIWAAMIHMHRIAAPPPLAFRAGLAYPVSGEITGEGVGAIRHGYFSTGVAVERVTDWRPGQTLAFDILSDPPSMHEFSPYAHVNAPHVNGYFKTLRARFVLTPLAGGRTRLTLTTTHSLDLEPELYWMPLARWTIEQNKARVLTQIERQAEGGSTP
ncbi:MAG TPA: DUF805 domain-containing protein [Caulobacteraceae bacterium]|nr:DUF805 domain-containing protein [Caulobacteraceae bacterium]